jgi:hypothetical protein
MYLSLALPLSNPAPVATLPAELAWPPRTYRSPPGIA